jgi:thiol-disulfide isomerase/thioredoxin
MKTMAGVTTAFLSLLVAGTASGATADLGDPAAELNIAHWMKGEPVKVAAGDHNIYVVEFWATWCPPCRASIPHLTEIQKRFRDKNVIVVGISDEKESVVAPFVKNMAGKMDYRVAIDDDHKTSAHYMQAYGIGGIPHSFVVRDEKVIWQGHPMAGLDTALEEITAGKYDLAKAKAKLKAESLYDEFRGAAAEGEDAKADELAAQIQTAIKDGSLPIEKFDPAKEKNEIRVAALSQGYRGAIFQDNEKEASEIGQKLQKADPSVNLETLREDVAVQKLASTYMRAAAGKGDAADQEKTGSQLAAKLKSRPEIANNVAWAMLTDKGIVHRDVTLALQISKQACEDTNWKRPDVIDTYARALFDSGKKSEAIKYEEKALAAVGEGDKTQYERTLQSYKEGKVPSSE